MENLANKPCYYCGDDNTKHWIDRRINHHSVGYTEINTVPCCETCNKMKKALDPDEFLNHCRKIVLFNEKNLQ